MTHENLDQYSNLYSDESYLYYDENIRCNTNYVNYCIKACTNFDHYLDLGLGHGKAIDLLSSNFKQVAVLEGSSVLAGTYANKYANVQIIETYFEEFSTNEKYENIGMGFILEHVDNPAVLLNQYAHFLTNSGRLYIGVPSASSMHRILAQKAGLLDDIEQMNEVDVLVGHKRLWTYEKWCKLFEDNHFKIEQVKGLTFKPFTTSQLNSLNLDSKIITALDDLSAHYPELANGLFFVLSKS